MTIEEKRRILQKVASIPSFEYMFLNPPQDNFRSGNSLTEIFARLGNNDWSGRSKVKMHRRSMGRFRRGTQSNSTYGSTANEYT